MTVPSELVVRLLNWAKIGEAYLTEGTWSRFGTDMCSAAARIEQLEAELSRLTGKMCLICGRPEPCELDKGEMSPCTFDPNPIEAAQGFHARTQKAEAELARLNKIVTDAETPPDTPDGRHPDWAMGWQDCAMEISAALSAKPAPGEER